MYGDTSNENIVVVEILIPVSFLLSVVLLGRASESKRTEIKQS